MRRSTGDGVILVVVAISWIAAAGASACKGTATASSGASASGSAAVPPPAKVELTEQERALAKAATIPERFLGIMKGHGKNLRRLEGRANDEVTPAAGVTVDVDRKRALTVVQSVQRQIGSEYLVFISEQNFGISGQPDNVSVLRTSDPYEAMRIMGTNGDNYGIGTERVIAQLKKWDAAHGLSFHGVGFDWLEAKFKRQPSNMLSFAKEVYAFCPDVVDQGAGTVTKLADEMKRTNSLYLWWD